MAFAHAGRYGADSLTDLDGVPFAPGTAITVTALDGLTPAVLYTDRDRTPLVGLPVVDDTGNFAFYAEPDDYLLRAAGHATVMVTAHPDPDDLEGYAPLDFGVNVKDHGVVMDGQTTGGSMTAGSPNLVVAAGPFTPADVGKVVAVTKAGVGGVGLAGTIALYTSPTTVVLDVSASTTTVSGVVTWGTDNAAALAAVSALFASATGEIRVPAGLALTTETWVTPGGVTVSGAGIDYGSTAGIAAQGSVIVGAGEGMGAVVQAGSSTANASGASCPILRDIVVDGHDVALYAVRTYASRAQLRDMQGWRGRVNALRADGQNTRSWQCTWGQADRGDVIYISNTTGDVKIIGGEVREAGQASGAQINVDGAANTQIIGVHMYGGWTNIRWGGAASSGLLVTGCAIEACFGPSVIIDPGGGTRVGYGTFTGNTFFQTSAFPDGLYPIFELTAGSGKAIRGLTVTGNTFFMSTAAVPRQQWVALMRWTGLGSFTGISVWGNSGSDCTTLFDGFTPDAHGGNFTYPRSFVIVSDPIVSNAPFTAASATVWRLTDQSLQVRNASGVAATYASKLTADANLRWYVRADGQHFGGDGVTGTGDTQWGRLAAGTFGVPAGQAIRTGPAITGSLPAAATAGAGAVAYDLTKGKPVWSNGTSWGDSGGRGVTLATNAAATGAVTVDLANGTSHALTLTGNVTLSLAGAVTGEDCSVTLRLTQDATGSRLVTWPASVKWPSGVVPTLSTAAGARDVVTLSTIDGGTTWDGFLAGKTMS